ncbi:hypothetical protein [Allochromatium vinosum]|uniref:hypothetical protein n=1 Tax=Allochromatium vinosum TaxID=1049 RepID=UPI0019080D59|nr:hypothetical protein [Allochromatium vinosum]
MSIQIDQQEQGNPEHQIRATVPALDPHLSMALPPSRDNAPLRGKNRQDLSVVIDACEQFLNDPEMSAAIIEGSLSSCS